MVRLSAIRAVQEIGAESVLECVGNQSAIVFGDRDCASRWRDRVCRRAARQRLEFQSEPFVYEKHRIENF